MCHDVYSGDCLLYMYVLYVLIVFSADVLLHVEPPTVSLPSYPVPAVKGKSVTLICNTTGTPPISTEWTKVNDSTVLSNTSILTLYNVKRPGTPNDTVQYRCTASNGYGDPASAVVTVQVYCKYIFKFYILVVKTEVLCMII